MVANDIVSVKRGSFIFFDTNKCYRFCTKTTLRHECERNAFFYNIHSTEGSSENSLKNITANVSYLSSFSSLLQTRDFSKLVIFKLFRLYKRQDSCGQYATVDARLAAMRPTRSQTATSTRDIFASRWCVLRVSRLYHVKLDRS